MWGYFSSNIKNPTKLQPVTTNKQKTQTINLYRSHFQLSNCNMHPKCLSAAWWKSSSYQFCAVLCSCSSDPQAKCSLQEAAAGNAKLSVEAWRPLARSAVTAGIPTQGLWFCLQLWKPKEGKVLSRNWCAPWVFVELWEWWWCVIVSKRAELWPRFRKICVDN